MEKDEVKSELIHPESSLISTKSWKVFSLWAKNRIIPKNIQVKRRRMLALDIYRIYPLCTMDKSGKEQHSYLKMIIRIMGPSVANVPITPILDKCTHHADNECNVGKIVSLENSNLTTKNISDQELLPNDECSAWSIGNLSTSSNRGNGKLDAHHADEMSEMSIVSPKSKAKRGEELEEQEIKANDWVTKYEFALKNLEIVGKDIARRTVVISFKFNKKSYCEKIKFMAQDEVEGFISDVEEMKARQQIISKKKIKAALCETEYDWIGRNPDLDQRVDLLIEVVGAEDLYCTNEKSCHPYVEVEFADKLKHKTLLAHRTNDPIWTLETRSLFLFTTSLGKFFFHDEGIHFIVKDKGSIGVRCLGCASVSPRDLYLSAEERKEYDIHELKIGKKKVGYRRGKLALRCRHASDDDKKFMEKFNNLQNKDKDIITGVVSPESRMIVRSKNRTVTKIVDGESLKLYKVLPEPDPSRKPDTEWMSKEALKQERMKPSLIWTDIGSGTLATIYIEILSCENLTRKDIGFNKSSKSDPYIKIVYEDSVVRTDVITNCLSPCYLPWTKRAFKLHMQHPSSLLHIGVFDYDHLSNDDFIGRTQVDVTNYHPGVEYILDYEIFNSITNITEKNEGTIKIRFRYEIHDSRAMLLSVLQSPPTIYVNNLKGGNFLTTNQTCHGTLDLNKPSLDAIGIYWNELLSYSNVSYFIRDGLMGCIFWRGRNKLKIVVPSIPRKKNESSSESDVSFLKKCSKEITVTIPLQSFVVFLLGIILVERPYLLPTYLFASIGFLLISTMTYRINSPNPWTRCLSFAEFFQMLISGSSGEATLSIKEDENKQAIEEYNTFWKNRFQYAEELQQAYYEEQQELQKELELNETDISSKSKSGFGLFGKYLFPIQQQLAMVCDSLRLIKSIVIWEESILSFWIVIGSFVLAFISLLTPWAFLLRWLSRLVVWVLLGPWMILVDKYVLSDSSALDITEEMDKVKKENSNKLKVARINRENAVKLKSMKTYLFGKYITKVPVLKSHGIGLKHAPLSSSTASPYRSHSHTIATLAIAESGKDIIRREGQNLVGNMIPKIDSLSDKLAPDGQAFHPKNKQMLQEDIIDTQLLPSNSLLLTGIKATSAFFIAGIITWFGTPYIIQTIKSIFSFPQVLFFVKS